MCAHGALSLSAKARESLKEALRDVDLERIRERLRNIARPTLIKLNATATETTDTTNEDVESAVDVLAAADSSISGINKAEGVDEYLYEGDVHLNEKQLSALEAAAAGNGGRRKRSFYADADRWTNNELFYYFDASIGDVMKTRVKTALNYIQARSCVKFTEDATAKAVVKVYSGSGCSSGTGMWPAGQSLSLSPGCGLVGIAAHEFMHALGLMHTQSRNNRDKYLKVDLTNVPAAQQSNYDKMETTNEIDYVPYEYGSVMHYDAKSFATSGSSLVTTDGRFARTIGATMVTFYDLLEINKHYNCEAVCTTGATCSNGGFRNPKNCATCVCPAGYGGATCNGRPAGCGAAFNAKATWTVRTFSVPTGKGTTRLDNPVKCNDMIWAPAGKKIQIQITAIKGVTCMNGCTLHGIQPRILADKKMTSPIICCPGQINKVLVSNISSTPVVGHSRLSAPTFTYKYRYV
ncbi:hypothetical protein Q1695_005668 [Nippostrongylus brasiliensis]|nr:hypothetical protein Q1695_005668 [Nippostrongylus brasiliensis]